MIIFFERTHTDERVRNASKHINTGPRVLAPLLPSLIHFFLLHGRVPRPLAWRGGERAVPLRWGTSTRAGWPRRRWAEEGKAATPGTRPWTVFPRSLYRYRPTCRTGASSGLGFTITQPWLSTARASSSCVVLRVVVSRLAMVDRREADKRARTDEDTPT
jgi:hypothetical protein